MRFSIAAAFALLTLALTVPASGSGQTADPKWSVGIGGGAATRYTYKTWHSTFGSTPSYDETFGNTAVVSMSLGRALRSPLSLQTGIDYFRQSSSGGGETARIGCWAAGVRLSSNRMEGAHPYVEVLPALFVGRWSDNLHDHSETSLRPGLTAGTGIVLGKPSSPVAMDLGVRGLLSSGWPPPRVMPYAVQEYHGVKRMLFGGKLLARF